MGAQDWEEVHLTTWLKWSGKYAEKEWFFTNPCSHVPV